MCSPAVGLGRSVGPYALAWPGGLGVVGPMCLPGRWVGSHLLAVRGSGAAWALVNWPGAFAWRGGRGRWDPVWVAGAVGRAPYTHLARWPGPRPRGSPRERGLPGPMHPKIVSTKLCGCSSSGVGLIGCRHELEQCSCERGDQPTGSPPDRVAALAADLDGLATQDVDG